MNHADYWQEKVVIVTGAGGNIGSEICRSFIRLGATVVASDKNVEGLRKLAEELKTQPGKLHLVSGNIMSTETVEAILTKARDVGGCQMLVNNAAIATGLKPILESTLEDWDAIFAVNLRAAFQLSLGILKDWVAKSIPGSIVNISSPGGQRAHQDMAIYDATKGGLDALTRAMAVDFGPYGIRINCVAPASVQKAAGAPHEESSLPMRRTGTPQDVAEAVVFLSSPAAGFISGHILNVDGGLLAQLRSPS